MKCLSKKIPAAQIRNTGRVQIQNVGKAKVNFCSDS